MRSVCGRVSIIYGVFCRQSHYYLVFPWDVPWHSIGDVPGITYIPYTSPGEMSPIYIPVRNDTRHPMGLPMGRPTRIAMWMHASYLSIGVFMRYPIDLMASPKGYFWTHGKPHGRTYVNTNNSELWLCVDESLQACALRLAPCVRACVV